VYARVNLSLRVITLHNKETSSGSDVQNNSRGVEFISRLMKRVSMQYFIKWRSILALARKARGPGWVQLKALEKEGVPNGSKH